MTTKGLFVTHVYDHYGAANSLRLMLERWEGGTFDVLVHRRLMGPGVKEKVRQWCSGRANRIWEDHLPADLCIEGASRDVGYWAIKNLLFGFRRRRILNRMVQGKYSFIHLNSLALHPLISSALPFILHVRELWRSEPQSVLNSINKAKGIVFIDSATRSRFGHSLTVPNIILENPVDMTSLKDSKPDREILERAGGRAVISLIARHSPVKGTHFVIETVRKNPAITILLVLAGEWDPLYKKKCRSLANGDSRILFLGDRADPASLYLATDVVLRAEEYFCVGRTVIEGLFSGCTVLGPWQNNDHALLSDERRWQNRIFRYIPRNGDSLQKMLTLLMKLRTGERSFFTNAGDYVNRFQRFVTEVCCGAHE